MVTVTKNGFESIFSCKRYYPVIELRCKSLLLDEVNNEYFLES